MTEIFTLHLSSRLGIARAQMIGRAGLGDWRPTRNRLGRASNSLSWGSEQ